MPDKPKAPPGSAQQMPDPKYFPGASRGQGNDQLDVRDILANFVGRGDKNLSNDEAKKDYYMLVAKLGEPMASKTMSHLFLFNNRPDQTNVPFEKKLTSLYTIGSNDKDVDRLLKTTGNLGTGPIAGAQGSVNVGNMSSTNRPVSGPPITKI
jgi:hypothetical protein